MTETEIETETETETETEIETKLEIEMNWNYTPNLMLNLWILNNLKLKLNWIEKNHYMVLICVFPIFADQKEMFQKK